MKLAFFPLELAKPLLGKACAGVLLDKSVQLSGEVFSAMQARGFRGEIYTLDEFQMNPRDWFALTGFGVLTIVGLFLGMRL
jgi:energy-coupling factor transporter transmembrane protein EcfT